MTHPLRSALLALVLLLIVAGLGWVAFRDDPVPVDLATVTRGPLTVTVDVEGQTRIREVYDVVAPMTGMAHRAPVHVGDAVTADETVVATVDPALPTLLDERSRSQALATVREAEAALHVAESQVREADEQLEQAKDDYARVNALVARGVMPEMRLDEARRTEAIHEAAAARTRASLDLARGTLERAQATLMTPGGGTPSGDSMTLYAPADGRVLSVDIVSAQPVAVGTPLLSIGDPADLEIVADLQSTDAVRLPDSARAIVERWGGPVPLEARLRRVEPAARTKVSALGIEEQRVDAVFDLVSPPETRRALGDGFAVFLRIVTWEGADVLHLPLSALFRVGEAWHVFVVEDGVARSRAVEIGHRNSTEAEVTAGLERGETVVLYPSDGVSDGVAVIPRDAMG